MQDPDLLPLLSLIRRDISGGGERLSLSLVPESLLVAAWPAWPSWVRKHRPGCLKPAVCLLVLPRCLSWSRPLCLDKDAGRRSLSSPLWAAYAVGFGALPRILQLFFKWEEMPTGEELGPEFQKYLDCRWGGWGRVGRRVGPSPAAGFRLLASSTLCLSVCLRVQLVTWWP